MKEENPFADLLPGHSHNQIEENPFSDLIPNERNSPVVKQRPFGDLIPEKKTSYLQQAMNAPIELAAGSQEGLKKIGSGLGQLVYPLIDKLSGTNLAERLRQEREADELNYQQNYGNSFNAKLGDLATESIPYAVVPGGVAGGLAKRMATGGLAGALLGSSEYVPENGSRAFNATADGLAGALLPPAIQPFLSKNPYVKASAGATSGALAGLLMDHSATGTGEGAVIGAAVPFVPGVAKNAVKGSLSKLLEGVGTIENPIEQAAALKVLKNVNPEKASSVKQAADRLGINITPAEAAGSPAAAKVQGKLGTSEKGADLLQQFSEKRSQQENEALQDLFNTISNHDGIAHADIRESAKNVISEKEKALAKIVKPLYDEAFYTNDKIRTIPKETFKSISEDPLIAEAIKKINSIPAYQKELKDVPKNSYKYLDYVKRYLDDVNEGLIRNGEKNQARILNNTKSDLLEFLDKQNDAYANARMVYGNEAQPIKQLKESPLGVISNLEDKHLKKVSKIIFDPQQTDLKILGQLRDEISQQNPEAWNRIVRNELESRMDKPGSNQGSTFYKKVLEGDRSFNQFMEATKNNPEVQQKLMDMRAVFKDLINGETTKGAAGKASNHMGEHRNFRDSIVTAAKNLFGGKYDQAAIKLITNNKWDKEFKTIQKIKNEDERINKLSVLLGRIAGFSIVKNNNQEE